MACDFIPVGQAADKCEENYAGTGTTAYLFKSDAVDMTALKIDAATNTYTGFKLKEGQKITPIALKNQANKVTSTLLKQGRGFKNVATIVVDKDLDVAAVAARVASNTRFGMLLPKPGIAQGAYILWNPNVDTTLEISDDTGDAFDSDNQASWTVSAAPMAYPRMAISDTEFKTLTINTPGGSSSIG